MSNKTLQRIKSICVMSASLIVSLGSLFCGVYLDPTLIQLLVLAVAVIVSTTYVGFRDNNLTKARIFAQETVDIIIADFNNNRKDPDEFWGELLAEEDDKEEVSENGLS